MHRKQRLRLKRILSGRRYGHGKLGSGVRVYRERKRHGYEDEDKGQSGQRQRRDHRGGGSFAGGRNRIFYRQGQTGRGTRLPAHKRFFQYVCL